MQTVRTSFKLECVFFSGVLLSSTIVTCLNPTTTQQVKTALARFGVAPDNIALLDAVLAYAGASQRAPGEPLSYPPFNKNVFVFVELRSPPTDPSARPSTGLFGSITDRLKQKMQMTLQGVNNVYTRHKPVFVDVIDQARKGKLKVRVFFGGPHTSTDGRAGTTQCIPIS